MFNLFYSYPINLTLSFVIIMLPLVEMNGTDGYGNMKVDVKLDDVQDDVKYDVPYSVTPTKKSQSIARCDAAR